MEIFIRDCHHPEDNAMLQSLYSRSPASVLEHEEKVAETGSGKFMDRYYVGYGHKSIGDCGSTTLFFENVSMLAAKAIQDNPLYNGQEASTRYLDFSDIQMLNPAGTREGVDIQQRWLAFYIKAMPIQVGHLRQAFPRQPGESKTIYDKAIKARAFDILRGFLPAGATTNLSWHGNLRQIRDHLAALRNHPIKEMREAAIGAQDNLVALYPNSFSHKILYEQEEYLKLVGEMSQFFPIDSKTYPVDGVRMRNTISADLISSNIVVTQRPPKAVLPHYLNELGQITFEFQLDFGSFRDLQRHRNGVCRMPLLTVALGFHPWYINNLAPSLQDEANGLIEYQKKAINKLDIPLAAKQYYVAMGFLVPCRMTRGLPGTVYLIELRSSPHVHPTARAVALNMYYGLMALYPELSIHVDTSPEAWSLRRGTQDIEER